MVNLNGMISIPAVFKTAQEEAVLKSISARHTHFSLGQAPLALFLKSVFLAWISSWKNVRHQLSFPNQNLTECVQRSIMASLVHGFLKVTAQNPRK